MFLILISLILSLSHIGDTFSRNCEGTNACMNEHLACSDEEDCNIECSGFQACRDTTVLCPIGHACNIKCHTDPTIEDPTTNRLTCYKMIINATQSTILNFMADFGDVGEELSGDRKLRTFENGQIYCPHNGRNGGNANNIKPCQIYCNGDDLMRKPKIYAVEGFNDIHITSNFTYDPWCIRGAYVHCKEDFNTSCRMKDSAPFGCQDIDHFIDDMTCEQYTITTDIPTAMPTKEPTVTTISPTSNPAEEKQESNPNSGLSTTQLILAILLPLLAVACVCMGFGIYVIKKKSDSQGKHTSIQNEEDDMPPPYDAKETNDNYEVDSDESKSDEETNTSHIEFGVDEEQNMGDTGIYAKDNNNGNNNGNDVQNGQGKRHKNTISGTYSNDEY